MKRSQSYMHLQRELADGAARTALDNNGHPLGDGWMKMEWEYLNRHYPGKQETERLLRCWIYAVARDLIEVRNQTEFRFK